MRFLIDTTTLHLARHNKFARVLRMLLTEAGDDFGLPVNVVGGDVALGFTRFTDEREFVPFWATLPRRPVQRLEDAQRVAKVIVGAIFSSLRRKPLSDQRRFDLAWAFAKSLDCFPSWLRLAIASMLEIETNAECRELFIHWIEERGPAFQRFLARDYQSTGPTVLNDEDVLVLAGASWNYVDIEALGRLRNLRRFRLVCFIYDLLPIDYPSLMPIREHVQYRNFVIGVGRNADLIVVPDNASLDRLKDFFASLGVEADNLVAYSMANAALRKTSEALSRRLRQAELHRKPFMLCVSGLQSRKHVLWLYALCAKLRNQRTELPLLVMTGSTVDLHILRILQKDPEWEKVGVFIVDPTDRELAWLYQHTRLSLHPSFEGGLGLSVTEAVEFERPCIVADTPSLVEASAGLAEHLPKDETLWARAICRVLEEDGQSETMPRPLSRRTPGLLARIRLDLGASGQSPISKRTASEPAL
jgi:glycosyltransferase involved in cell wall biosynthesis